MILQRTYNCIKAVRESIGNEINLRIDANGKWNLSDAISNLNQVRKIQH